MRVTVKISGSLMYEVGFSEKEMEIPVAMTLRELLVAIRIPHDAARIVTRNGAHIAPDDALADGDRLFISPIYSGG